MANATGEAKEPPLRLAFDRRLKREFHGARITADGGLLAYRELDDALGLTTIGVWALAEGRRGTNIRHHLPTRPVGRPPKRTGGTAADRARGRDQHLRRAGLLTEGPPRSSVKLRGRGYPGNPGSGQ